MDIDYSWNMRTRAGYADLIDYRVRLNARLLKRNPAELDDTLVHELAHIAAVMICGLEIRPHGREWAQLMRVAGYEPTRTHPLGRRRAGAAAPALPLSPPLRVLRRPPDQRARRAGLGLLGLPPRQAHRLARPDNPAGRRRLCQKAKGR